eukprot:10958717-Alexandrium_andersonii.AAC.1
MLGGGKPCRTSLAAKLGSTDRSWGSKTLRGGPRTSPRSLRQRSEATARPRRACAEARVRTPALPEPLRPAGFHARARGLGVVEKVPEREPRTCATERKRLST